MSGDGVLAGPWGATLAIVGMMAATFLCRASGFVLMSRIRLTPRVERALRALPGSIVIATIVPIAAQGGSSALLGLGATILAMSVIVRTSSRSLRACRRWRRFRALDCDPRPCSCHQGIRSI